MRARAIHRAPLRSGHARQSLGVPRGVPPGFTLVELLVVISIFVLLLAIGVPAFSSLLYSSDQSTSENALRQALAAGRDAAAQSPAGQDGAAVFFYDQHRLSILPCRRAGAIDELTPNNVPVRREIFVPVPGVQPMQLPRLWMVRGYAPPGRLGGAGGGDWYEGSHGSGAARPTHWLFPETSFFDPDDGLDGRDRQTFMVRFEGGTGKVRTADPAGVLVFAPSPGTSYRNATPWLNFRADREADGARFVRRVLALPPTASNLQDQRELLGDESSDTVLAKPLGQLAVYNERRLAGALGARIDDGTGCLYQSGVDPQYVTVPNVPATALPDRIDEWILDRMTNGVESDARLFSVHPHLGWLQEVTGTQP